MVMENRGINVKERGAKGDGSAIDTKAIQSAIDECEDNGGGTVYLPSGQYRSGTLHLCDDLELKIMPGARLIAVKDKGHFDEPEEVKFPEAQGDECAIFHYSLLAGEGIGNVRITGGGSIDDERLHRKGPKPIGLKDCYNITIRDINIYNSPNYAVSLGNCEIILIENVRVFYSNADGIDLDCCRNAQIVNCSITSRDDSIVLKGSLAYGKPLQSANIVITNCDLATSCVGFKIGTESNSDFKNITFSNCVIHPLGVARSPLAGIALETVDGGHMEGLTISNVSMMGMKSPLLIRLGRRLRGNWPKEAGSISNISINNLSAVDSHFPIVLSGLADKPIRRISISNCQFEYDYSMSGAFKPGQTYRDNKSRPPGRTDYSQIPEREDSYPDIRMFGDPLPAWAVFARHISETNFSNVHCYLETKDSRPAEMFIDAKNTDLHGLHFH